MRCTTRVLAARIAANPTPVRADHSAQTWCKTGSSTHSNRCARTCTPLVYSRRLALPCGTVLLGTAPVDKDILYCAVDRVNSKGNCVYIYHQMGKRLDAHVTGNAIIVPIDLFHRRGVVDRCIVRVIEVHYADQLELAPICLETII